MYICVCISDLMLFTYVVLHPPFILGEQVNEVEVMPSEQEACSSHTATAVVSAAVIHCVT